MKPSLDSENGRDAVWQSIENLRLLETSLASLYSVIERKLREGEFFSSVEQMASGGSKTDYHWCYFSDFKAYSLKKRNPDTGYPRFAGELSVRIELWREAEEESPSDWPFVTSPLVYIGFDPEKNGHWEEAQLCLNQYGLPRYEGQDFEICVSEEAPWLWEWKITGDESNGAWAQRSWFVVLPLYSIKRRRDVDDNIVGPAKQLLAGGLPFDAFRHTSAISGNGSG